MEECLICGAPLEYLEEAVPMECAVCHRKEDSCTDYNREGMDCSSLGHSMP